MIAKALAAAALAAAGLAFLAAPAAAETCATGSTDIGGIGQFCVSSVLAPQGANFYGPENLSRNDDKAWCEGVKGEGKGEWIRLTFAEGTRTFKRIRITNGYGKTEKSFKDNSSVKKVEISADDRVIGTLNLPDTAEPETWVYDKPITAKEVRIKILDVYGNKKYQDTCVNAIDILN